jgi:hypothetical protein
MAGIENDVPRDCLRRAQKEDEMSRNGLYAVIGILVVAVAILSIAYMRESNEPSQITIGTGENGISIEVD